MISIFRIISIPQYALCILTSVFTFITLGYLLYCQTKHRERLISTPILINILTWLFTVACNLPYTSFSTYSWFNGGIDSTILFWFGAVYFAATTAVSISVFFLLLDRCFILIGRSWLTGNRLHTINAIFVIIDFFVIFGIFVGVEELDPEKTTCQTFSCVTVNRAQSLYIVRIIYGTLNTLVASAFALILYQYNNKRAATVIIVVGVQSKSSATSKSNIIAGINVMSQIVFNFLPNLAAFLTQKVFGITLNSIAGPLIATSSQLDAFCTTLVYLIIVGGRVTKGKSVTSSAGPTTTIRKI
ncbi:hypothetical protein M3Y96_01218700 [Aphelenchoides besseyi]|nr:hypothetical protein M3Y96_01218700 [Aphelenchoides besseyi]